MTKAKYFRAWKTAALAATLAVSGQIAGGQTPTLTAGTAANGATYLTGGLVSGSWAIVKGSNLSTVTRSWTQSDFAGLGNALPTNLSGVQVLVNNLPAAVSYISPGQINFQVPDGVSGTATVQVINNGVATNTITADAPDSAPGIFPVMLNGTTYPAALFTDGKAVGDPMVSPVFRNARPGDAIQMFGTAFISSPAGVQPGTSFLGDTMATVTVGSVVANVQFVGIVGVGLFQVNFTVPQAFANMPEGMYPITVQFNGVSSPATIGSTPPSTMMLPVQH